MREWLSHDEEETERIGGEIAALLPTRLTLYLDGDLGAGKTTLVKSIAVALGADPDAVSSPTFSIVNEYETGNSVIVHLDCYRLSDHQQEWEEIGIRDILDRDGVTLVEWPKEGFDRYVAAPGRMTLEVKNDDSRTIRLELPG